MYGLSRTKVKRARPGTGPFSFVAVAAAMGSYVRISTGTPRGRVLASLVMPGFDMRMHPELTSLPMEDGSLLPWIPITASPPAKGSNTFENPDRP